MDDYITINVPIKLDKSATYKALVLAAEDKKTTPELLFAQILNNREILGSDQYFDAVGEALEPYGYFDFLEEDE